MAPTLVHTRVVKVRCVYALVVGSCSLVATTAASMSIKRVRANPLLRYEGLALCCSHWLLLAVRYVINLLLLNMFICYLSIKCCHILSIIYFVVSNFGNKVFVGNCSFCLYNIFSLFFGCTLLYTQKKDYSLYSCYYYSMFNIFLSTIFK